MHHFEKSIFNVSWNFGKNWVKKWRKKKQFKLMWRFRIDSDRNCLHLRTYTYKQFISVIWLHSSIHYCQPSPLITVNYIVKHLPLCYFVHGWINKTLDYTSVSSLIFLRTVNSIFLIFIFIFFLLISDELYKIVWKNVPKKLKLFWKLKKNIFFVFSLKTLWWWDHFQNAMLNYATSKYLV